jgi:hypothetical protein
MLSATKRALQTVCWVAALSCLAPSAVAQTARAGFEITPFASYRVGGRFEEEDGDIEFELAESNAWGIVINGPVSGDTEWELMYAHQATEVETTSIVPGPSLLDMDVDYLQFGGTYLFDGERARPFVALTLGATRFDPQEPGYKAKTRVSTSLGGGWKIDLGERFGARLEVRGFATFLDTSNRLFCESNEQGGTCLIIVEGNILAQWEARAGFTFRF